MQLFKWLDKFLGTPLAYLLGLWVRPKPAPTNPRRILVIKLVAMGDIIVLLPALHALRQSHPQARITFLTTPSMRLLLQNSPDIDEVLVLAPMDILQPSKFWKTLQTLHQYKFGVAIEMDHYYRLPSLLTFLASIPHRIGFDIDGQGRNKLLTMRVKYRDDLHAVENFARLAEATGADIANLKLIPPTFPTTEADANFIRKILSSVDTNPLTRLPAYPLIVIHPGTSATAKSRRWPTEKFAQLADKLNEQGYQIVFTGAEEEEQIVDRIISQSHKSHLSLVGETTLSQLLELFKQAQLVISLDTGPMHLSATSGTPTLGLFGANSPASWGPYGPQHRTIYRGPEVPCTRQQYGQVCRHPEGHHMQDVTVDEVFDLALIMLNTPL